MLNGHVGHEESASIHVADIARLTAVTMSKSVCRWAGTPTERVDWRQSETSGSSAVSTAAEPRHSKYRSTSGTGTRHESQLLVREAHRWTLGTRDEVWEQMTIDPVNVLENRIL